MAKTDPGKKPDPKGGTMPPNDKKKAKEDEYLDEALEETFPASDPIAPPRFDDSKN